MYKFGDYSLDTESLELKKNGAVIEVEPQVFSLLACLIENAERVVSKDELIELVWDGRIVSDGTLNTRINSVRRAVGDDGKRQEVIKTFPRRGFRFVAELDGGGEVEAPRAEAAISDKPSIAVLPFDNLSGDPEQEYFSDGISQDIITALGPIRWLRVASRNSSFSYRGQSPDVRQVARDLDVRYVLEGSVRCAGARVRITAQLIEGETGKDLWADKYDRDLEDIFAVQDDITSTVVSALAPELAEAERERAKAKLSENLDAWDLYQRGMSFVWDRDKHTRRDETSTAKEYFRRAFEIDPDFSAAYSGYALCCFYNLNFSYAEDKEAEIADGFQAGHRAVALDSGDANAHDALGMMHLIAGEPHTAEASFQKAVELNPNFNLAKFHVGLACNRSGDAEGALVHLEDVLKLSVRDAILGNILVQIARAHFILGDYEISVERARSALMHPETGIWGNCTLIAALGQLDRQEEAADALAVLLQREPRFSCKFFQGSTFANVAGSRESMLEGLQKAGVPEE